MLNQLRHLNRLSVLAALVFGLVLSLAFTSLSPATASAATCGTEHTSGVMSGKVVSLTANSFSVIWPGGGAASVPFAVNSATKFFLNGKAATFADLKIGQAIEFIVKSCGDGKYTATTVYITAPPPPATCNNPATSALMSGKVAGKTADSFTVIWTNGALSNIPFAVNSATKFFLNGKPATFADLKAGQYIQFIVKSCGDGKYTATMVYLTSAPGSK